MTEAEFEYFKNLLVEKEQALTGWLSRYESSNSDGTLKVRNLLMQVKDALQRIVDRTYDVCKTCKGQMEKHRLESQPIAKVCLGCISDEERRALEYDLTLAAKIHRALLPQAIPSIDGYEIAVKSQAARQVGGDYFDFLHSTGDNATRIVIADIMGKGIPAGLIMSNLQSALRILADDIKRPALLVDRLNRWLCRNMPITKFISLICLELSHERKKSSQLNITNAGHCPPLLVRGDGRIELLDNTSGVLGVHEDFEYFEYTVDFNPGDSLLLYTDGITEAAGAGGEMFGEKRLIDFISANHDMPLDGLLDLLLQDIKSFSGSGQLADDLTIIAVHKEI